MSAETKYIADVSDISAIRFECAVCGAALVQPPAKAKLSLPSHCHTCGEPFFTSQSNDRQTAQLLVECLKDLANLPKDKSWRFRLEFGPTVKSTQV
jgi:hypothetical protein